MPFLLIAIGLIVVLAAARNTIGPLATQLSSDLGATQGGVHFLAWLGAIVLIGAVGYVPNLQTVSRAMMLLVILVIVLKNGGGLFSQLQQQIANVPASQTPPASLPAGFPAAIPVQIQGGTATSNVNKGSATGAGGLPGALNGLLGPLGIF